MRNSTAALIKNTKPDRRTKPSAFRGRREPCWRPHSHRVSDYDWTYRHTTSSDEQRLSAADDRTVVQKTTSITTYCLNSARPSRQLRVRRGRQLRPPALPNGVSGTACDRGDAGRGGALRVLLSREVRRRAPSKRLAKTTASFDLAKQNTTKSPVAAPRGSRFPVDYRP
jgi:hypothetical protein